MIKDPGKVSVTFSAFTVVYSNLYNGLQKFLKEGDGNKSDLLHTLALVPFPHKTGKASLADIHLLLLTPVYRSTQVTDPTAAELCGSPRKVPVVKETRDWDDLTRS